jgi:hypothetical protein
VDDRFHARMVGEVNKLYCRFFPEATEAELREFGQAHCARTMLPSFRDCRWPLSKDERFLNLIHPNLVEYGRATKCGSSLPKWILQHDSIGPRLDSILVVGDDIRFRRAAKFRTATATDEISRVLALARHEKRRKPFPPSRPGTKNRAAMWGFSSWERQNSPCQPLSQSAEVFLDLFQCLALRLRQVHGHRQQIDDRKAGKQKEHGRVPIFANHWKEDGRQRRRNHLVDH